MQQQKEKKKQSSKKYNRDTWKRLGFEPPSEQKQLQSGLKANKRSRQKAAREGSPCSANKQRCEKHQDVAMKLEAYPLPAADHEACKH